jgi:transposase
VIGPTGAARVMIATKPVDFRKGADSLAALVRENMGADPFSGAVYVFRARRADRIKLVYFDGTGVCLFSKRLEDGKFQWPTIADGVVRLTSAQLQELLGGLDWRRVHERRDTRVSATIFALSSSDQSRRRPVPVKTSNRRTGLSSLDLSLSSEIVMCRSPLGLQTSALRVLQQRCQRDSAYTGRGSAPRDRARVRRELRGYGARKVWRQMTREGFGVARCTVKRLMQGTGLASVICGKPVRTTISGKSTPCPLDRVNRVFHAPSPNRLWLSDFTYISTYTNGR